LWPIDVLTGNAHDKPGGEVPNISETLTIYSSPLIFGLFLLALLAAILSAVLIGVFFPRKWLNPVETETWERRICGWLKLCADAVFEKHSFTRRAYLFCLAVSVLIISLVGMSVFARFLKFSLFSYGWWSVAIVSCIVLSALVWAMMLTIVAGAGTGVRESLYVFNAKCPRCGSLLRILFFASLVFTVTSVTISLWLSLGWVFWAPIFSLFCLSTFLALFAAFFIGRKLWIMFWQSPNTYKKDLPGALIVIVFPVGILMLALLQAGYIQIRLNPAAQLFYHLRTVKLDSGLSPLVPLFFVASGAFLWILCSLRRVRMVEALLGPDVTDPPKFLNLGGESAPTLAAMEKHIKDLLISPLPGLPGSFGIAILVGVPCFLFFVWGLVHSIESGFFYWFFGGSFFLVYIALAFTALRFLCVWWQTRRLLGYMSSHRIILTFKTLGENSLKMPKMDLSDAFLPHAALQFSFDKARSILPSDREKRLGAIFEEIVRADVNDEWQQAMKSAHEAQVELSTAAAEVAEQLRDEWHLLEDIAKKEKQTLSEEESRVQKKAAFLAAQLVVFLHHVLSHLQNMIAFVTVGLLLMLLAINYYPFQPREWLLWFNWVVILTTVFLALAVFVQIGRSRSLSLLAGTTPGQVTWNREFVLRILLYALVPVLALLGAQFPETLRRVLSSFGAFNGVS
jgi:hypothetical protein